MSDEQMKLECAKRFRKLREGSAITQCTGLSLNDRQIVPPVIDGVTWCFVRAIEDARMLANDLPFGSDHDKIRIDTPAFVDRANIGAIGVCGSGSFVISAAKIDPRIKAVATVSTYDMGPAFRDALNKSQKVERRKQFIARAAEQRWAEADGADIKHIGDTTLELTAETGPIQR